MKRIKVMGLFFLLGLSVFIFSNALSGITLKELIKLLDDKYERFEQGISDITITLEFQEKMPDGKMGKSFKRRKIII